MSLQRNENTDTPAIWTIGGGGRTKIIERCMNDGLVAIDFDIRAPLYSARTEREIETVVESSNLALADGARTVSTVHQFVNDVAVGDVVLLRNGITIIEAVGVISSAYRYNKDVAEYPHYRNVTWIAKGPWDLSERGLQLGQNTVVSNSPQSERFTKIKGAISWHTFEKKIPEIRENYLLAKPFSSIFRDREEASWAFDLIQDALVVLDFSETECAELTAITIQSKPRRLSLSLGGRWLVSFAQESGQLEITWCVASSKESARSKIPKREFTTRGMSSGYIQLSEPWSDFFK